MLWSTADSN